MAIKNPSFEDPGASPGLAEHWTLVTSVAGERIAGFGPEPYQAWEDFERWYELRRDLADGDLTRAFFDARAEAHEDFEEGWSNDIFLHELPPGQTVAAVFGSGRAVEDLEAGWNNAPYAMSWDEVAATPGLFGGMPIEDFEQDWRANHTFAWAWSEVTSVAAAFGESSVEDFEAGWTAATTL